MSVFDIFKQLEKDRAAEPAGAVEYIICGLGNPGTRYENMRHNTGFMAVDTIAESKGASVKKLKFKSLTGDIVLGGKRCLLMKPTTFMNLSGEAVVEALNFYKLDTKHLIVIHDDVSMDVGRMRIRFKGSDGGHNGIKNIILLTGSDEFARIKIGVGQKPHKDYDLADWVLGMFSKEDGVKLEECFKNSAAAAELIVNGDNDKAMNLYNR